MKFITLFVLFFATTACQSEPVPQLHLSLEVDQKKLALGKIVLVAQLDNNGQSDAVFLAWNTPFDSALNGRFLEVSHSVEGNSEELQYLGRQVKRMAPTQADYTTIEPGVSLLNQLDINDAYDFCVAGKYTIRYAGGFRTAEMQELNSNVAEATFERIADGQDCR